MRQLLIISKSAAQETAMNFEYFDPETMESVITTQQTPFPVINYLGTRKFFSVISNTAEGYSFYRDSEHCRLTRYISAGNAAEHNGHYFYINDGESVWSPTVGPCGSPLDRFECRHGFGFTRFTSKKGHIASDVLYFVPVSDPCEIRFLTLTNTDSEPKTIRLFSAVEWSRFDAAEDTAAPETLADAEIELIGSVIFNKTGYSGSRNHYAFCTVNDLADTFDVNRRVFYGPAGNRSCPECTAVGSCFGSTDPGTFPIAAHEFEITLDPGEARSFIFLLGCCENPSDDKWDAPNRLNKICAGELIARYRTSEAVEQALSELIRYWRLLLGLTNVDPIENETEEARTIRISKVWNQYRSIALANIKAAPEAEKS